MWQVEGTNKTFNFLADADDEATKQAISNRPNEILTSYNGKRYMAKKCISYDEDTGKFSMECSFQEDVDEILAEVVTK